MNFEENTTEMFDRYLAGQMDEAEARNFLQQLDTDPALKDAFEWHRTMVAGIREARREELKNYIRKNSKIRPIGMSGNRWLMASAAVIVLLFGAYVVIRFAANKKENTVAENKTITDSSSLADGHQHTTTDSATGNEKIKNKSVHSDEAPVVAEDEIDAQVAQKQEDKNYTPNPDEKSRLVNFYSVKKQAGKRNAEENQVAAPSKAANQFWVYFLPGDTYSYVYATNRLTLYKVDYNATLALYETENGTYLSWQKNYYKLNPDGKNHPLEKLADASVIKGLPPLK